MRVSRLRDLKASNGFYVVIAIEERSAGFGRPKIQGEELIRGFTDFKGLRSNEKNKAEKEAQETARQAEKALWLHAFLSLQSGLSRLSC